MLCSCSFFRLLLYVLAGAGFCFCYSFSLFFPSSVFFVRQRNPLVYSCRAAPVTLFKIVLCSSCRIIECRVALFLFYFVCITCLFVFLFQSFVFFFLPVAIIFVLLLFGVLFLYWPLDNQRIFAPSCVLFVV